MSSEESSNVEFHFSSDGLWIIFELDAVFATRQSYESLDIVKLMKGL